MSKQIELKKMFSDPDWKRLNRNKEPLDGLYPNHAFKNSKTNTTALVVLQSLSGPDFPAGKFGMDKLKEAKEQHDRKVYVVLAREVKGELKFIAQETYGNVNREIGKKKPTQGEWGPYWWINQKFKFVKSDKSNYVNNSF